MGCCQSSTHENEVVFDRTYKDNISIKPFPILHPSNDTDIKVTATPSFGAGNRKFIFEGVEKDSL